MSAGTALDSPDALPQQQTIVLKPSELDFQTNVTKARRRNLPEDPHRGLHFSAFGLPQGCEGVGDAAHDLAPRFRARIDCALPASIRTRGYSEWSSSHLRIHMGQRFDTTLLAFESSLNRVGATASWASSKLYRPAVRPPGQGGEKPMLKRMSEPKLA